MKTHRFTLTSGKSIDVSAKFLESGVSFPNSDKKDTTLHNKFRVTVKFEGRQASFDFYGSHEDWERGVQEFDNGDCRAALYSFASDARAGDDSFDWFCSEFGYDDDSRTAEKIYKLCQKTLAQAKRIGLNDDDLTDLCNEIY